MNKNHVLHVAWLESSFHSRVRTGSAVFLARAPKCDFYLEFTQAKKISDVAKQWPKFDGTPQLTYGTFGQRLQKS